jgi:HAMP domain-containing protein
MRSVPISRLFLILLGSTFLLVVVFSIRFIYRFAEFSNEAARLSQNLQDTSALNLELREKLNEQINLVYQQLEHVNPGFPGKFTEINFKLGEQQDRYLKLDIGPQERLTVERIKTLQSELGIRALQIFYLLQSGDRTLTLARLREIDSLQNNISNEFANLNELQTSKLREVQQQLNTSVKTTNRAIYGLAAYLLMSLVVFTILLRRRVLLPLRLLLKATNQIRQGDFSARANVGRLDELGQLAHGFNFMAASLGGKLCRPGAKS